MHMDNFFFISIETNLPQELNGVGKQEVNGESWDIQLAEFVW